MEFTLDLIAASTFREASTHNIACAGFIRGIASAEEIAQERLLRLEQLNFCIDLIQLTRNFRRNSSAGDLALISNDFKQPLDFIQCEPDLLRFKNELQVFDMPVRILSVTGFSTIHSGEQSHFFVETKSVSADVEGLHNVGCRK
jgi:hypothetical protein